uniref:Conotoxin TVIIA n=1 Tax=Conus tulipa TaxID=6495 RepID=U7A_CONTU|nr:RecName: Full=Conotoxin TVIIA [Conus tulipa]
SCSGRDSRCPPVCCMGLMCSRGKCVSIYGE